MKFTFLDKLFVFRNPIRVFSMPTLMTWGITNRTSDNYFLPFLDYDLVEYNVVKEDVDFLQKNFSIGTVITRVTSHKNYKDSEVGSFHVFGFTKHTFPECKDIINMSRCDDNFKRGYRFQQRCWVLRVGKKIGQDLSVNKPDTVLREVIPFKTSKTANMGMVTFFETLDDIRLKKYFNHKDKVYNVETIRYVTKR